MSKEAEFMFYQNLYISYAARLQMVHQCALGLKMRRVKVTQEMLERNMQSVYCDSRHDEECIREELDAWITENKGDVPLFDYRTLTLLTGNGEPSFVERNTHVYIDWIIKKSEGWGIDEFWKGNADTISFKGFYQFQIDMFVAQMKTMAEDALEALRDIGTTVNHYMVKQRVPLNPVIGVGPTPDYLASDKTWDDGAPMFSIWWLTHACGGNEFTAGGINEELSMIVISTEPDSEHPPLLTGFSSNTTSRIDLGELMKVAA